MSTRHTVLSMALLIASAGIILPATAQAASVYSITGDDLKMNTLGSEYIHSRRIGLMPYWGPCYRCETKHKEECSANNNSSNLVTYSGNGRPWTVKDDNCTWYMNIDSGEYANQYDSTLSWNNSTKSFSGYLNFTGTSQIGYLCGGNSGIQGSGSSIFPMNSPTGSNGCTANNQGATGQPFTLVNGEFQGGPITIGNAWGSWNITAAGSCLAVSYNGSQEGDLCAFTTSSYQSCHDFAPTSNECQVPYNDGPVRGISVSNTSSGVSNIYCGDSSIQVENTAQGKTCPGKSGITVCANGICRNWTDSSGVIAGGSDSYQLSNPSVTYSPTGSYWDWGYCDGPNQAGSCTGSFEIYYGPTTGMTGPNFLLTNSTYTPSSS